MFFESFLFRPYCHLSAIEKQLLDCVQYTIIFLTGKDAYLRFSTFGIEDITIVYIIRMLFLL